MGDDRNPAVNKDMLPACRVGDNCDREQIDRLIGPEISLLDLAYDAVPIHDSENRVVFWNRSAHQMYGWTSEEAVGKKAYELLHTRFPIPFADIRALLEKTDKWEGDLVHTCRDGRQLIVNSRWALHRAVQGDTNVVVEVCRDVTDQQRVGRALKRTDARLRALFSTVVDGILAIDERGAIQMVNPAAELMFGYSAEELIGQNVRMLMPEPFHREHDNYLRNYMSTGQAKIIGIGREVIGSRRDGTTFPLELAVGEMRIDNEKAFVGTLRDVTERKRLEQQLLQSQKMEGLGRLAGGVAHDYNNLLSVILGYAEQLEDGLEKGNGLLPSVANIRTAANRAARLTAQLLAFARRQPTEAKVFPLNDLLTGMTNMVRPLLGADIELVTLLAEDGGQVRADPNQLEQVILNLIINGRDAMPGGGKLILQTRGVSFADVFPQDQADLKPLPYMLLTVTDTGTGMTEDVKAHVFEPFFTTKEHGKGTGLGLATSYGIIKQAGGYISVYSELGLGTMVKVYLPRVDEAPTLVEHEAEAAPVGGTETVLVVEDEPMMRSLITDTLKRNGYSVLSAENGAEALHLQEDIERIDVVVTDTIMPLMGGKELIDRLRAIRPGIPVLLTSGYNEEGFAAQSIVTTDVQFLQKPFASRELLARLRQALRSES